MGGQSYDVNFNVRTDGGAAAAMSRLAAETQKAADAEAKLNKLIADRQKKQDATTSRNDNDRIAAAKVRLMGNFNPENQRRLENAYAAKEDRDLAREVRAAREEQRKTARAQREAAQIAGRAAREEKREYANSFAGRLDSATRRIQQGESIREELIRRGVIADPKLAQAAKDRNKAIQEQASGQKALLAGLLGQAGLGAGVSTFGNVTALGEATRLAGYGGAGNAISKAALPLAFGASGLEGAKTLTAGLQDEYLTDAQRARAFIGSNAVGRYLTDTVDTFSGRKRAMQRAEEQQELRGRLTGINIERQEYAQSIAQRQALVTGGVRGAAALQGAFRRNTDRDTVAGRLEYEQESRLLPLRQATAKAGQEYAAAKYSAINAQTNLNKLETTGNELAMQREQLQKRLQNLSAGPVRQDVLYQLADNDARQQANIRQQGQARQFVAEQIQRREDALTGVNSARLAERAGNLENLRMREQRAEDRAANLALLGPAGRIQGQVALDVIQNVGIENAPPQLVQQAQAMFPEKVRELAVKAGQQFEADAAVRSPEYNDRLADLRKRVDQEEEGIQRQTVTDSRDAANRQQKALDEAAKVLENFTKRISLAIDQFEKDQLARRSAQH